MKKQIKRISILQSSKIIVALYVMLGLIYALIGIPMIIFGGEEGRAMGIFWLFSPIFMGIVGFIGFAIFAAIYNLLAGWVGGIEIELVDPE